MQTRCDQATRKTLRLRGCFAACCICRSEGRYNSAVHVPDWAAGPGAGLPGQKLCKSDGVLRRAPETSCVTARQSPKACIMAQYVTGFD
jgi:hypothetical protein